MPITVIYKYIFAWIVQEAPVIGTAKVVESTADYCNSLDEAAKAFEGADNSTEAGKR